MAEKVDSVFDPDTGHLSKSLDELFSDGSSSAVQHRIKELVAEALQRSREDMTKLFTSSDGSNPLARTIDEIRAADKRQREDLRQLALQVQQLRDEKQKLEELAEERERGTAKGRTYEEAVAESVDGIAAVQGDSCEAVGDERGAGGKKGDVVVGVDGCAGPPRGRIVFEAKDSQLTKPKVLRRPRRLDGSARRRLRDPGRARPGGGAGEAPPAPRVPGRQDDRPLRPRGRVHARARVRLPRRTRAGHRPPRGRRRDRSPPPCAPPWRGPWPRWTTCARSSLSSPARRTGSAVRGTSSSRSRRGSGRSSRRSTTLWRLPDARAAAARRSRRLAARPTTSSAGRDLLLHRLLRAGAHLVGALGQCLLDRGGVLGLDRADALLDGRALEGHRVRVVGLVGDRDDERPGADVGALRRRHGDAPLLDHSGQLERHRGTRLVLEVVSATARRRPSPLPGSAMPARRASSLSPSSLGREP